VFSSCWWSALKFEFAIEELLPDDGVLPKFGRLDKLHILQMILKMLCEDWRVP